VVQRVESGVMFAYPNDSWLGRGVLGRSDGVGMSLLSIGVVCGSLAGVEGGISDSSGCLECVVKVIKVCELFPSGCVTSKRSTGRAVESMVLDCWGVSGTSNSNMLDRFSSREPN